MRLELIELDDDASTNSDLKEAIQETKTALDAKSQKEISNEEFLGKRENEIETL